MEATEKQISYINSLASDAKERLSLNLARFSWGGGLRAACLEVFSRDKWDQILGEEEEGEPTVRDWFTKFQEWSYAVPDNLTKEQASRLIDALKKNASHVILTAFLREVE